MANEADILLSVPYSELWPGQLSAVVKSGSWNHGSLTRGSASCLLNTDDRLHPALDSPGSPYLQLSLYGCFRESRGFGCQQALWNISPSVFHSFISFPADLSNDWPASVNQTGTSLQGEVWEVQLLQSFLLTVSSLLPPWL